MPDDYLDAGYHCLWHGRWSDHFDLCENRVPCVLGERRAV